jgi:hypothetical protein
MPLTRLIEARFDPHTQPPPPLVDVQEAADRGRMSRRDQVLAQAAFYSGARGVLTVLDHLLEHGQDEELRRTIQRQGRQIKALQGLRARARQH